MNAIAPTVTEAKTKAAVLRIGKAALEILKTHRATSMSLWTADNGVMALVMVDGLARNLRIDTVSSEDLLDAFEGDFITHTQHLLLRTELQDDDVAAPMRVEAGKGGVYVFVNWSASALARFGIRQPFSL